MSLSYDIRTLTMSALPFSEAKCKRAFPNCKRENYTYKYTYMCIIINSLPKLIPDMNHMISGNRLIKPSMIINVVDTHYKNESCINFMNSLNVVCKINCSYIIYTMYKIYVLNYNAFLSMTVCNFVDISVVWISLALK